MINQDGVHVLLNGNPDAALDEVIGYLFNNLDIPPPLVTAQGILLKGIVRKGKDGNLVNAHLDRAAPCRDSGHRDDGFLDASATGHARDYQEHF
jgi:hypothetical protein